MALVLKDRVKETTSTSGTGSITLAGPVQGYQGFSVIGNGNTTYYTIAGTSEWEVGVGTYSGGVLSRDTVLSSSASGAKVAFSSGIKDVFCTYAAGKALTADTLPVTIETKTDAPNATVNVSSIKAAPSSANGDLALAAKGTGALLAQVPDSTVTGGNKRGTYAVDWQMVRTLANEVASGAYSGILSGHDNKSIGLGSVVGGGYSNYATNSYSVIAGGFNSLASGLYSFVGGGYQNSSSGYISITNGGAFNSATNDYAVVSGGYNNSASGNSAFVAGGQSNVAAALSSSIVGGLSNTINSAATYAVIGGGRTNSVSAAGLYGTVAGGRSNAANANYAAVGGGQSNAASGAHSAVTGGFSNTASAVYSGIVSGNGNTASGVNSLIGGGAANVASGSHSAIAGGFSNTASALYSGALSGSQNKAEGVNSVVAGGTNNTASGVYASIAGGVNNTASASYSSVIGGSNNAANSNNSIVLGGQYGTTRELDGFLVIPASSAPIDTKAGVTQSGVLLLGAQTTNATPTVLRSNSNAAGATNQLVLANNSAIYVFGYVIANVTGAGDTKSWIMSATIKRGANAGFTSIVGSLVASQQADAGASAWDVTVAADTAIGCLVVTVTGQASTTIRWVCKLETVEVAY